MERWRRAAKQPWSNFMVYISKSYFHLWYLPMLIGLLIITPMLWEIVNSARGKQWEEYMIVLFLVFQILPYTINYFPLPWKDHIMDILQTVQPEMVTGYIGYFILGHYLSHYEVSKKTGISGLCTGGNIDFWQRSACVTSDSTEIRKTNTVIL